MRLNVSANKNSIVKAIVVLSVLLVTLSIALVWLVSNEFGAENLVSDARIQLSEMQKKENEVVARLVARETEIVRLRAQSQPITTIQDTSRLVSDQERDAMLAKVKTAEAEVEWARQAAKVAQNELSHAIEQSGKIEENLRARLALVEKEKDEAQKAARNTDTLGTADIATLKRELNSTLQQLISAKTELLTLRSATQGVKDSRIITPPPVPPPAARPLSSTRAQRGAAMAVFGQVKAVETVSQFVIIQLNTTEGVFSGTALTVTRQGIPVGILKVYRVGPQNVVYTTLTPDLRDKVRVGDQVILQK